LKNVSRGAAEEFRRATDQAERLKIVISSFSKIETESQRASFAKAAFGRGGLGMARALGEINESGGFDKIIKSAKDAGAVIDAELIKRAEKLGDEIEQTSRTVANNLNSAIATVATSSGFGRLEKWAAGAAVRFRRGVEMGAAPVSEWSSDTLDIQLQKAEAYRQKLSTAIAEATNPDQVKRLTTALEAAERRLTNLRSARAGKAYSDLATRMQSGASSNQFSGFERYMESPPTVSGKKSDPDVEAKIELDRLKERATALSSLVPMLEQVRAKELGLREATQQGVITQAEANRIIAFTRLSLDAQTIAMRERLGVATESERIAIKERELDQAVQQGTLSVEERARALAIYRKELAETVKYEPLKLSSTPVLSRLSIDAADLQGKLDQGLAGALRGVATEFDIFNESADTASVRLLKLAKSFGSAISQATLMKTVVGPLSNALSGMLSGTFGGGLSNGIVHNPGGFSAAFPMPLSAKGNVFGPSGKIAAFSRGGIVSAPTLFPFAKGVGLMGEAGEEAIMPLTRGPGGKLGVHALGAGGGVVNNVQVINNSSAKITEQRRERADGGVNLVVMIEDVVSEAISSGKSSINAALQGRYGVDPTRGIA
jgi:phage-related minor tail protein